jgi:hypothetical protein
MRFLHLIARFAVVSSSKSSGNGVLEVLEYCNLFLDRFAPAKRVEVAQYTVFLSLYELILTRISFSLRSLLSLPDPDSIPYNPSPWCLESP